MLDIEAFDQNWQLLELDFNKKLDALGHTTSPNPTILF